MTLSWQPPRHNSGGTVFAYTVEMSTPKDPKAWTVLTNCCQGNSYQAKNLKPDSEYLFRVRAENIHGVSKGSRPSEAVRTSMFEVEQAVYATSGPATAVTEDKPRNVPRRRHSINLHLEGTITSILNHTDIQVKTTTNASSSSSGEVGARSGSSQELDKDREAPRSSSSTLQRDAALRCSLQLSSRKRSLPILLPGTRTNSLTKLRDSQTCSGFKGGRAGDATDSLKRRELGLRSRSASDAYSNSSGSKEDVADRKSCCSSRDESSTDDDPLKPAAEGGGARDEDEDENETTSPWERDDSVNEVSDRIMSAPLCDDVKMALYARSVPDSGPTTWVGRSEHAGGRGAMSGGYDGVGVGEGGLTDFRTLRSLLHSDDILVKATRSLPDVAGVGLGKTNSLQRNNNNNKLTTIVDLDEEEESVRVTTL